MDDARTELLGQVAVWYYEDGLDQTEIARRIGKSRSLVSKMLNEVKDLGFVEVRVNYPLRRDQALERELEDAFGLDQAWILSQRLSVDNESLIRLLGKLGARCLESKLFNGARIGVSWGSALEQVVRAMPRTELRETEVIQILGSISQDGSSADGSDLARALAAKLHGNFRLLVAPVIVNSPQAAESLLQQRAIRETLEAAARVDIALIGIGTTNREFSSLRRAGFMDDEELASLVSAGAVGDVLSRCIDIDGSPCHGAREYQIIGLSLEQLSKIPSVIAIAGSPVKTEAILGALRGNYVNVLVTDTMTARQVMKRAREVPR